MNIDLEGLAKIIEEISGMTPVTGSDYSLGYHASLMYIKKYLMGKNPFEVTFNNQKIAIEKQN
jgi:hypothetical protein